MIVSEQYYTLSGTSSATLPFHSADSVLLTMAEQPEEPVAVPTGEGGGEGPPSPIDSSSPPLPPKPPPPDLPLLPHEGKKMGERDEESLSTGARIEAPELLQPQEVVHVENGKFP